MKKHRSALRVMTALSMLRGYAEAAPPFVSHCFPVERPWRDYHVPKAARKGKTPEEIDALRMKLWEQRKQENEGK
jgi:hypothetical protein